MFFMKSLRPTINRRLGLRIEQHHLKKCGATGSVRKSLRAQHSAVGENSGNRWQRRFLWILGEGMVKKELQDVSSKWPRSCFQK